MLLFERFSRCLSRGLAAPRSVSAGRWAAKAYAQLTTSCAASYKDKQAAQKKNNLKIISHAPASSSKIPDVDSRTFYGASDGSDSDFYRRFAALKSKWFCDGW